MVLETPTALLEKTMELSQDEQAYLRAYESYWQNRGEQISLHVDRSGTPWLRMFNQEGKRVDEILYPGEYHEHLYRGYQAGHVWRVFKERRLRPFFLLGYVTSYYDPGLYCPYTVSLATALMVYKYGDGVWKEKVLTELTDTRQPAQGATWMTEIKGGSDLGNAVETMAIPQDDGTWLLNGEKYFASNVGAEYALVAARPRGKPKNVRGLSLFLVPRYREDGTLNYVIRRIKDKIGTRSVPTGEVVFENTLGYLIGDTEKGIYYILEALNVSRVANSVASVALAHRAFVEAYRYASQRVAFGRPIIKHPLLHRQFHDHALAIERCFTLVREVMDWIDNVIFEVPPYSPKYHAFRLLTHLTKYWTAVQAVNTARWSMEVHGGLGVLAEMGIERWLREALILPIWEGTSHRQILDALEVMARKHAHETLLNERFKDDKDRAIETWKDRLNRHLNLPADKQEALSEEIVREFTLWFMEKLGEKGNMNELLMGEKSPAREDSGIGLGE